ncbi:sigma-54 interaction domain-containing protein [Faecalimicrobium dakarense]|uniref:sigma-54 interaction domain-containing protein n=1 Tax=Faecalimicrobium dakarense TaxID=1301100 RepID=UPI0004B1AE77|nr:sigma-54-dependent Fis family transcriptional regulator [[Clostridium] dakarense]
MEVNHKLFDTIDEAVFVLKDKNVKWINKYSTRFFDKNQILNINFYELFNINDKIKENQILDHNSGRKFKIKYTESEDLNSEIIIMKCINDYKDDKVKLHCLEKVVESIDNGIVLSDLDGKIVLYNKWQEYLDDNKKEEVLGKKLWEVYDYGHEHKSEHQMVYKTRTPIKDAYKVFSHRYAHYSTYPIELEDDVVGVFSVSTNEKILQDLLLETIEIKRQIVNRNIENTKKYDNKNGTRYEFSSIVGGEKIRNLITLSQKIALLESNILIIGETGTGKEVFAQSIHNYGKNKNEPFIPINCAAIPENLLESILFGTVKGSYTGAADTAGLFEEAGRGTIFLDELNSMPISMQTKLLRVIQERRTTRIGSSKMYNIECRIVTAINEEPKVLINDNRLRQDLFYRISSLTIKIPPLRERKEDIELLTKFYISKYNIRLDKSIEGINEDVLKVLKKHNWPGNVRELEHIIENLFIACEDNKKIIDLDCLTEYIRYELNLNNNENEDVYINKTKVEDYFNIDLHEDTKEDLSLTEILNNIERKIIVNVLEENNWNISKSSKQLNIIRQSLIYRIKKLDIAK